jgi:hypothetical protein
MHAAAMTVLVRDYGIYDMAEIRLAEQKGHKIADNFYVRKDGTRAFYFSEDQLRQIFEEVCACVHVGGLGWGGFGKYNII